MSENSREIGNQPTAVVETWPNLMFLGLGIWWAWVWLCFNSVRVMGLFPEGVQSQYVMYMYATSTIAAIACMVAGGLLWRKFTPLLDKRWMIMGSSAIASVGTLGVCFSGVIESLPLFCASAVLTGVGTSALCLKAGRIYGSVTLAESLTAGSMSALFGSLLYFVGIGIPSPFSQVFIAALPILSAALLTLPWSDPYPAVFHGSNEHLSSKTPERIMLYKVAIALAVVTFTAGVAKGISSLGAGSGQFALSGLSAVFFIGVVAVVIVCLINRARSAHGIRMVYTVLMVAGIVEMLATCFGFNIYFLEVGKAILWLMFWCFSAYLVFKFDFSAVRTFGFVLVVYYCSSLVGWGVGGGLAPYYLDDVTMRTVVGVVLACLVIVVLLFVLTESDIKRIVEWSYESSAGDLAQGIEVHVPLAEGVAEEASPAGAVVGASAAADAAADNDGAAGKDDEPEHPSSTDSLERARDPKYGLSKRELEILEPFAQGRSANWIADHFFISKNTVRSHLRNIYSKLDVHTRQELLDFLTKG